MWVDIYIVYSNLIVYIKFVAQLFTCTSHCFTGKYTGERGHGKQPGRLMVHVGNALGSKATVEGGFAGLLVDIFSDGAVIPALQQSQTWQRLKERLRPGGTFGIWHVLLIACTLFCLWTFYGFSFASVRGLCSPFNNQWYFPLPTANSHSSIQRAHAQVMLKFFTRRRISFQSLGCLWTKTS